MGLLPEIFWDLTWEEYEYQVKAYNTRLARSWEPTRELMVFIGNMFRGEKDPAINKYEFMPLLTDPAQPEPEKPKESDADFWARMAANNFYQTTPTE